MYFDSFKFQQPERPSLTYILGGDIIVPCSRLSVKVLRYSILDFKTAIALYIGA